ncbi:hypothetical protein AB0395_03960 [Streptosporangium sp. NPDC051023]|uniref:hypothetical protein n=1 Tax=Streptosporangium sp. NPDC051023 TaxID=3155410 RepID=UPI00344F0B00
MARRILAPGVEIFSVTTGTARQTTVEPAARTTGLAEAEPRNGRSEAEARNGRSAAKSRNGRPEAEPRGDAGHAADGAVPETVGEAATGVAGTVAGETVLRTASGEFLPVQQELGEDLDQLDPGTLRAFEDRGLLVERKPRSWPGPVAVVGGGAIALALSELLARVGAEVRRVPTPDAAFGCAAVSWCHDDHPPAEWAKADVLLAERAVAWQRCSVEGATAVIEPISHGPEDVTHTDVRARRLAASSSPGHLQAYWTSERRRGPSPIGPAEAWFVAALLAADLEAWAARRTASRRLRLVDLIGLTVTEQPILPLHAVSSRES